jgi:hypothetical protein
MSLDHFYVNRYRFTIKAKEKLTLPAYKGTTIRGGFGITFRRMVCYQPEVETCDDCLLRYNCPYTHLFDTYPPPDAAVLRHQSDVPLPLIIEPPLDEKRDYLPGETLTFHVTLVGEANRYLSYVAVAFQELGRRGLGKQRGHFSLHALEAVHPYTDEAALVHHESRPALIQATSLPVYFSECGSRAGDLPTDEIALQFLTPTRLKDAGQIVSETPSFHVIWRALMRRISSLSYFHCGQQWNADYRGLVEASRSIEMVTGDTRWATYSRYSTRQEQRIAISGVEGTVKYRGNLRPFLPFLVLGELIHVGKATVFGNGRYQIVSNFEGESVV